MLDWFFAQAPTSPSFSQDVVPWAQVASSGFVGCLVWYLITVQLPRMTKEFSEDIRSARKSHADELAAARASHADELASARGIYVEQVKIERSLFLEQTARDREECNQKHTELMEKIQTSYEVIREVRHEVANMAQHRAMERATQEMRKRQAKDKGQDP